MTPAQQHTHQSNRTRSHQQRHPDDPLTDQDIDRVVLIAIDAGGGYREIQAALARAREAARDEVSSADRG
jgi:hypothetical protein